MIQEIGIQFGAKGVETILESFDKIDRRITETANKFMALASQLNTLSGFTAGVREMSTAMGSLNGVTQASAKAMGSLSANTHSAIQGAEKLKNITNQIGSGGSKSGGGFGGLGAALPYMLQWRAISAAIQGTQYAIKDVGMGGSREKIAGALGELSAVSFNSIQKGQAERSARGYSAEFSDVKSEDVIKAMSQTASAYSVEKLGVSVIARMNEAAMNAARLSKMPDEAMAELMSKYTNSFLMAQDKATYKALQSGERANVKGFGNVNIAEMYEKTSAMLTKTVEVSNIWGKDIANFMQYAGPVMAQKGWDPATGLAWAGVMSDTGFKGQKAGRAEKDSLVNSADDFARLMLWDKYGAYEKNGKRTAPPDQDVRQVEAYVNRQMGDPKKWVAFLESMIPVLKRANEASKVDGTNMIRDFKFSKEFIPQMFAKISEGAIERFKEFNEAISNASYAEVLAKRMSQLDDTGTTLAKFNNAWDRLIQGISKSENALSNALGAISSMLNNMASKVEAKNEIDEITKDLKRQEIMQRSLITKKREDGLITSEQEKEALNEMKFSLTRRGNQLLNDYLKTASDKIPTLPENATDLQKAKHQNQIEAATERAAQVRESVQGSLDSFFMTPFQRKAQDFATQHKAWGTGLAPYFEPLINLGKKADDEMVNDQPPLVLSQDARRKALVNKIDGDGAIGGGAQAPNVSITPDISIYLDGRAIWNALVGTFSNNGAQWGMNSSYGVGE